MSVTDAVRGGGGMDRREFLGIMGASLALAGLNGCSTRQPEENILPYVDPPQGWVPGEPRHFATTLDLGGSGVGLLIKSEMGRPIKVEGNPRHPSSLGSSDAFAQASLLTLYDPARSTTVIRSGLASTWSAFCSEAAEKRTAWLADGGKGLRILSGPFSSPSLEHGIHGLLTAYPEAKFHTHSPIDTGNARAGSELYWGKPISCAYRFDRARIVASFEEDFLGCGISGTRYAKDFAQGRLPEAPDGMSRLYAAEGCPTLTGAAADARLPIRPDHIPFLMLRLAKALELPDLPRASSTEALERTDPWIDALARDLAANRGRGLVLAGESQPPWVHALAHALNDHLGNTGNTVVRIGPPEAASRLPARPLRDLTEDMSEGRVDTLILLGCNPAYTAPADLGFAQALARVPNAVHAGLYRDETAALCRWHIPAAHYLESWGDARAHDGTLSLVQPLIAPLYGGKTALEIVSALLGRYQGSDYERVRDNWAALFHAGALTKGGSGKSPAAKGKSLPHSESFDAFWNTSLAQGFAADSASRAMEVPPASGWIKESGKAIEGPSRDAASPSDPARLTIAFRPDPTVWDGSFSENAWLQELPKPMTKLTWGNAAQLSPATAKRLGIADRDELELEYRDRKLIAPARILPGQADDVVCLTLGYGRRHGNPVATGLGYDAYSLRMQDAPWQDQGLAIRKTGRRAFLAATHGHHSMEGRNLVVTGTAAALATEKSPGDMAGGTAPDKEAEAPSNPDRMEDSGNGGPHRKRQPSLYPEVAYTGHAWGMAIDLSLCTGCSSCVVACQAENNIPVVGRDQVAREREMHWIRVDAYFTEGGEVPETLFQPVPCMHCENAPCELVCPVEATVHDSEGLNAMVYNRCVGTRYCSNNCPYKVRRFNFLQFSDARTESLKLMRNPDVTVRNRGVMEKCTYCVQRIERARIKAEVADRPLKDGDVVTACAQACPTGAIVFGDINDSGSRVAGKKRSAREYALLEELNTRPRTTYLSRIRNPPGPGAAA
jgi:molybdopterin-containing oxidoreductase family iron-sulfur binding subunit